MPIPEYLPRLHCRAIEGPGTVELAGGETTVVVSLTVPMGHHNIAGALHQSLRIALGKEPAL